MRCHVHQECISRQTDLRVFQRIQQQTLRAAFLQSQQGPVMVVAQDREYQLCIGLQAHEFCCLCCRSAQQDHGLRPCLAAVVLRALNQSMQYGAPVQLLVSLPGPWPEQVGLKVTASFSRQGAQSVHGRLLLGFHLAWRRSFTSKEAL